MICSRRIILSTERGDVRAASVDDAATAWAFCFLYLACASTSPTPRSGSFSCMLLDGGSVAGVGGATPAGSISRQVCGQSGMCLFCACTPQEKMATKRRRRGAPRAEEEDKEEEDGDGDGPDESQLFAATVCHVLAADIHVNLATFDRLKELVMDSPIFAWNGADPIPMGKGNIQRAALAAIEWGTRVWHWANRLQMSTTETTPEPPPYCLNGPDMLARMHVAATTTVLSSAHVMMVVYDAGAQQIFDAYEEQRDAHAKARSTYCDAARRRQGGPPTSMSDDVLRCAALCEAKECEWNLYWAKTHQSKLPVYGAESQRRLSFRDMEPIDLLGHVNFLGILVLALIHRITTLHIPAAQMDPWEATLSDIGPLRIPLPVTARAHEVFWALVPCPPPRK